MAWVYYDNSNFFGVYLTYATVTAQSGLVNFTAKNKAPLLMNTTLFFTLYILPSGRAPTCHILLFSNASRMRGENMTSCFFVRECVMRGEIPRPHRQKTVLTPNK